MRRLILFAVICFICITGTSEAQYVVGPSVIAGGGSEISGGGYVITSTIGQSSPIGVSTGGTYVTNHGFWYAVQGGGGALSPMSLSITLLDPSTAQIYWDAVDGATFYDLYRNQTPYFTATGSPWLTIAAPTTHRNFTGGIGNEAVNYFFRGIARNASDTSPESNIVGEMDYDSDIPGAFKIDPTHPVEE